MIQTLACGTRARWRSHRSRRSRRSRLPSPLRFFSYVQECPASRAICIFECSNAWFDAWFVGSVRSIDSAPPGGRLPWPIAAAAALLCAEQRKCKQQIERQRAAARAQSGRGSSPTAAPARRSKRVPTTCSILGQMGARLPRCEYRSESVALRISATSQASAENSSSIFVRFVVRFGGKRSS